MYQEVNLLPNMSVADNLFIGREPRRFGLLRRKEMEARATKLMASYGFSLDVREGGGLIKDQHFCREVDSATNGDNLLHGDGKTVQRLAYVES